MSKRLFTLLILVVGVVFLAGCGLSVKDDLNKTPVTQVAAPVEWNFIVYLDGDNNLEPYAISDLNEMEQVGSNANMNILVLIDRAAGYDISNGDWTGTRLYKVTKDAANSANIVSELVADYGEMDMSNPTNLQNFIVNCQQMYPANRTVLTLWNHGDGIYPRSNKGICWDDTTGTGAWDCLTNDEVASALAGARAITGKKIDILNCDACLMQHLEVAYEWRYEAQYLVASQETIPGEGNNYDTALATLANNPMQTTETYAKALVTDYNTYYARTQKTTLSVLKYGTEFDNLVAAFKGFATAMNTTTDLAAVTRAKKSVTSFTYPEYDDLYNLADKIASYTTDANVKAKVATLKTAIGSAILLHKETGTYVGNAFGISIFCANGAEWAPYRGANQYVSFNLSIDSDWDDFVKRYVVYTGGTL